MDPAPRNRQLDLLRGLAIALVLGRHLPEGTTPVSGPLASFCRGWYQIGWCGVDLFFVLSGFLVAGLLFGEFQAGGKIRLGRFILRRGLRIWPAFYFMIAVSALLLAGRPGLIKQLWVETLFLQSYLQADTLWPHTWTLAIEEYFYLGLGVILLALSKDRRRDPFGLVPFLWLLAAVSCLWSRLWTPYDDIGSLTRAHNRVDALFFGVALSYLFHFHRAALQRTVRRFWPLLAAGSALALIPVFRLHLGVEPFLPRFGLTLTYLAFGAAMLVLVFAPGFGETAGRAATFFGERSYSIYLWHIPVMQILAQPLAKAVGGPGGLAWAIAVYLAGSFAAGWLSYDWIERPVLRWRDRRLPPAARAVPS